GSWPQCVRKSERGAAHESSGRAGWAQPAEPRRGEDTALYHFGGSWLSRHGLSESARTDVRGCAVPAPPRRTEQIQLFRIGFRPGSELAFAQLQELLPDR